MMIALEIYLQGRIDELKADLSDAHYEIHKLRIERDGLREKLKALEKLLEPMMGPFFPPKDTKTPPAQGKTLCEVFEAERKRESEFDKTAD